MKIGILAAMEQEVRFLKDRMDKVRETRKANQTFYDGELDGKAVTLVQSGIGKVNASIATVLLINDFNVDAVINTGSAGGLAEGLKVGDLVVSTELSYNDADVRAFGYTFGQVPQMPARYQADPTLVEQLIDSAKKTQWDVTQGLIVSGDSFVSSEAQTSKIKEFFPDVYVTEMEGAAVAQTCYQFDTPFAVVRALSDTADEEATVSFDAFIEEAGKKSAEMVWTFVRSLS